MNKKSSSQSAFFNFRVLLLLCAVGTLLVLAALGARPGGRATGPQQPATAPGDSQISATQTQTNQAPTASAKDARRASAIAATKLSGPQATGVFYLGASRTASANQSEAPNQAEAPQAPNGATLTTDQEDYQPYTYVYMTGTGFSPGETVNMIVLELAPDPAAFEPWDVVADANGNFETSWYIFTEDLIGATMQVTATGQTSNFTASATFTDAVPPKGVAPVNPPTGGFAIDGDLLSNTPTSPSPFAANQGDWYHGSGGSGGNVLNNNATGTPVDSTTTFHLVDAFNSATDDNLGGGDKVDDNPNTWNWKLNPVNDKLDMNNALIHVTKDPMTGHTWIMIAGDRFSNNGDAYIDFEFLQNTLTTTPLVAGTGGFSSAGPNCGRTINDFLLTLKLTNGGTVPNFFVSRWVAGGSNTCPGTSYDYVDVTTPVITATPPAVFAAVNASAVTVPNLTAFGTGTYPINTFTEAAVDLTALLGSFDPCLTVGIKTICVKTKTSQAATANIVDFIVPQQLVPPLVIGPTVDAGPDQSKCEDPSLTTSFNLTGTAQPGTYPITSTTWSCVSSCTGVTINSPSTLATGVTISGGPRTVTLRLTVTDSGTCANHIRTDDVILTVNQVVASSSASAILCNGGTSTVTVSATGGATPYSGTGTFTRSAGTYSFTVTDANSCTATTNVEVTQPPVLSASESHDPIGCFGGTTTVHVTATGGTGPYTGTGDFPQGAGSHTYTVTDANGCTSDTTVTLTEPPAVVASNTHGTISCFGGTTTVHATATGGTAPYTGTGDFPQGAGSHTYTVTDANGCTSDTTVTLTEPAAVVAHETHGAILCYGQTTSVTISATGGTGPYTGTGDFPQGAGSHTYTVTDANGCTDDVTVTLTQPAAVVAHETHGAILCYGQTTSVTISATGGTGPYTGTGTFQQGAGSHTYTVTDANGCTDDVTVTLTQPAAVVAHETHGAILCYGQTTSVTISATGGTGPYTGTGTFQQGAGSHTYTVTDANGCTDDVTVTLTQPAAVVAHETHGAILCYGQTTSVTISATGGTGPYTGTGTFQQGAGSHTYTVTDANGCTSDTTVTLTEPPAVVASNTHGSISCFGGTTTVHVTATGGTGPYTGTGDFPQGAGSHTYTVTDANGCTSDTTVTLTEPPAVVASNTHGSISCFGGTTTVHVTATGGTGPYTGTGDFPQGAGSHTYTVTDANGCTSDTTVTLSQPPALSAIETHDPIGCFGGTTTVNIAATGGTPPYTGDGAHTNVAAGPFDFPVTDHNGCITHVTGTISQPPALSASSSNTPILCNGGTSTVTVTATGGTPPYQGTGTTSRSAGTYSYTVTDHNGCTATTTGNITQPSALTLSLQAGACSSGSNGSVTATFGNGTAPYQVKIDAGAYAAATSPKTFTGLAPGSHTITVKDANGCTKSNSVTVASCPTFCSLTQGAYGNAGGKYTYNGVKYTTTQLLQLLTSPAKGGALVVGVPGVRSLTIQQAAVTCLDGDNSCRLARLPANTAPAALPNFGDKTLNACGTTPNCQTNPAIPLQGNAQWQSNLLGQTVTLTLNTRLDPTLPGLVLPSCVSVRPSVLTALNNCGYSQTVGGLLNLANKALAGQSTCGASLSDINNAIDSINQHFDSDGNNRCPSCQQ